MEPQPITPEQLFADTAWLRQVARSLVSDPEAAEDLVQETWLARLRSSAGEPEEPRAWMRRVLSHRVAKWRRGGQARLAREQAAARAEALPSTEDLCMRAELQRILGQELLALEEPVRTTMMLRFLEGLSPADIAQRLGAPVNSVRWRLRKGQERLRERLEQELGEERDWRLVLMPFAWPAGNNLLGGAHVRQGAGQVVALGW
jgi:RNA polymerase sigma-70 factor (ECF subfamily)